MPSLRAPVDDGRDSEMMADSVPGASRTAIQRDGGHFSVLIGTVSAIPVKLSAMLCSQGRP
jgi:hypothetical protein